MVSPTQKLDDSGLKGKASDHMVITLCVLDLQLFGHILNIPCFSLRCARQPSLMDALKCLLRIYRFYHLHLQTNNHHDEQWKNNCFLWMLTTCLFTCNMYRVYEVHSFIFILSMRKRRLREVS